MYALNVALRDPKVKRTRGNLHMAHDNLATRDESVKRGGGGRAYWGAGVGVGGKLHQGAGGGGWKLHRRGGRKLH